MARKLAPVLLRIPSRQRERLIRLAYALAHDAVRLSAPMLKEAKMVSKRMTETTITRSKQPETFGKFFTPGAVVETINLYTFVCDACGQDFMFHIELEPGEETTPTFCPLCGRRAKT